MFFDKKSPIGQLQVDTFRFYKVRDIDVYIKAWPLLRVLLDHQDYMLAVMTSENTPNRVVMVWVRVPKDLKDLQRVRESDMPSVVQTTLKRTRAEDLMEEWESLVDNLTDEILRELDQILIVKDVTKEDDDEIADE